MIRRNVQNSIQRAMADTPIVLLSGARQTGKTTLVRSLAAGFRARYYTLDDAATLALAASDPDGFIRNLGDAVVLDEIQKAPGLFPAMKLAVDQDRQPGRFLLTGSANVMTLPHLSESLAGRMEVISLFPFSAGELHHEVEGFLPWLFSGNRAEWRSLPSREDIASRLTRGGYPEAIRRENEERRAAWFASYLSAILLRDVRDLARVEGLHSLPNLLKLLAARSSGLINLADVGRDAGLPHTTLTRYLALLETVFLIRRLPAWSRDLGQRLVKAPKLHLVDTGLACHLLGANARRLYADRNLLGRLLESFTVTELFKQISWTDPRISLFHFRSSGGAEIDIVLEKTDGSVAAIEIKASQTAGASDFRALKAMRDQLGGLFRSGVVFYLGDQILPFGDRLWLLPIQALWSS